MNKKALMLMASRDKGEKGRRVGVEYEDWGVRDGYPMLDPYSGRPSMGHRSQYWRGHDHYDDSRDAPMSIVELEDRGYRRYSDGRFAPRSDYHEPWMDRSRTPTTFDEGERRMNPIGFARDMGGSDATMPQYHEMDRMQGPSSMKGYSDSRYQPHFDRQMAEEWTRRMENEDGTRGPHWTMEQAKQVMAQKEIGGSPLEFYVALNAMYSDYSKVAKKLGVNTVDFYACMAEAFLDDKDAQPDKLARYYEHVVKH